MSLYFRYTPSTWASKAWAHYKPKPQKWFEEAFNRCYKFHTVSAGTAEISAPTGFTTIPANSLDQPV